MCHFQNYSPIFNPIAFPMYGWPLILYFKNLKTQSPRYRYTIYKGIQEGRDRVNIISNLIFPTVIIIVLHARLTELSKSISKSVPACIMQITNTCICTRGYANNIIICTRALRGSPTVEFDQFLVPGTTSDVCEGERASLRGSKFAKFTGEDIAFTPSEYVRSPNRRIMQ